MATVKQMEANRLNAQKSTGPQTGEGKQACRRNALKHGVFATEPVLACENPEHFDTIRAAHFERFQPATPEEVTLVAALVRSAWLLERLSLSETEVWRSEFDYLAKAYPDMQHPVARAQRENKNVLGHVQSRLNSLGRNYRNDLKALLKLQAERAANSPQPAPAGQAQTGPIGSVNPTFLIELPAAPEPAQADPPDAA